MLVPGNNTGGSALTLDLTSGTTGNFTIDNILQFTLFSNAGGGALNPNTANTFLSTKLPNWSNLVLGTGSTLNVNLNTGVSTLGWIAGDAFHLFDWVGTIMGTAPTAPGFTNFNLPLLDSGLTWDASNLFTTGNLSIVTSSVPEPSRVNNTCARASYSQ